MGIWRQRWLAMVAFLPVLALAATPTGPRFTHYTVDTSQSVAEACLVFDRPLDAGKPHQYADYLKITPATKPALRVDEKKLCLTGLSFATPYDILLLKGLPAGDGSRSTDESRLNVDLGDRKPRIGFTGNGAFILPRRVTSTIGLESVNVEEAWITLHRLNDRMIVPDLRDLLKLTENRSDTYQLQKIIRQHTTPLWHGTVKIRKEHNQRVFTTFPFAETVRERKPGAYLVTVQDAGQPHRIPGREKGQEEEAYQWDDYDEAAIQWVVDTDLGLSVMKARDGLDLFVRSLASGQPVNQAEVALVAVNNEILGQAKTDGEGHVRFDPGLLRGGRGLAPAALMVYGPDGDFTLMDLKRPAFDLSDRGVAGRPHPGEADAFLYTDRGIYRPGEVVHLAALLRNTAVTSLPAQPMGLVVRRPNGSEFRREIVPGQGDGAHLLDVALPVTAARGIWQVVAHQPGDEGELGRVSFDVQDFVPQRLKVLASLKEPALTPGAKVVVPVDAVFLYGAPASGLKGESEMYLRWDDTPFAAFKEYRFGRQDEVLPSQAMDLELPDSDARGHTQASGLLKLAGSFTRPMKAEILVRMVEPGGRVTSTSLERPILASRPLVGLRPLFKGDRVREKESARFHVVVVAAKGEALARQKMSYALFEETRNHHWFFRDNRWQIQTVKEDRLLEEGLVSVTAGQPGQIAVSPGWGRYRLEVKDPAGGGEASMRFHVGWGGSDQADVPDKAEVLADKEHYAPGEVARVRIQPPAAGPVQVVVATDRIWHTRHLQAGTEGVTVEIPVDPAWGPGAYVLVTTYRPLGNGKSRDPVRSVGVAWLGVDPAGHALQVSLDPPSLARPGEKLAVPVQVEGSGGEKVFLTLAAVDEGILQLTRFKTPAPLEHFMGKRRLAVELRDDYGRLLDGGQGPPGETRSGGDSLGGAGLPVVPVTSVALFSGLVPADDQGRAVVELDLPDFNGTLRLMAVAHSRSRVGSTAGEVTVRHPLVGEVSLPRFLAPGDEGRLTLLVQNMDAPSGEVTVQLAGQGAIRLPDGFRKTLTMAPADRLIETIPVLAEQTTGIGQVVLSLAGGDGYTLERTWSVAVRSPHPAVTVEETAAQKPGESWSLANSQVEQFEKAGVRISLNYGLRKDLDVPGMLQSLERYPFGCTEQLTSRAMALLYHGDANLLMATGSTPDAQGRAATQEILNRILERQDADGAIGLYRAGDGMVDHYLAGFVMDMLRLAAERGFFVPATALETGSRWLRNFSSQYVRDYYQGERSIYLLYVLAKLGEVNTGELRYLHDSRMAQLTSPVDRAALGAALFHMGDVARAVNAFNQAVALMDKRKTSPFYYGSTLQEWAAILALALEARQEKHSQLALAGIARHMAPAEQLNTQEKAWLLRAASLLISGEPLHITRNGQVAPAGKGSLTFDLTQEAVRGDTFVNQGKKEIWRTLSLSGPPRVAWPAAEKGLSLERRLFSLTGQPLSPENMRQNDRFLVSLLGRSKESGHRHLVMTELLPAGWEIEGVVSRDENGKSPYPFLPGMTLLALREARDDRLVAAFDINQEHFEETEGEDKTLEHGQFHVAYVVRAVTPGRFVLPPVMVQDMYRPTVYGRGEAGVTVVAQP